MWTFVHIIMLSSTAAEYANYKSVVQLISINAVVLSTTILLCEIGFWANDILSLAKKRAKYTVCCCSHVKTKKDLDVKDILVHMVYR